MGDRHEHELTKENATDEQAAGQQRDPTGERFRNWRPNRASNLAGWRPTNAKIEGACHDVAIEAERPPPHNVSALAETPQADLDLPRIVQPLSVPAIHPGATLRDHRNVEEARFDRLGEGDRHRFRGGIDNATSRGIRSEDFRMSRGRYGLETQEKGEEDAEAENTHKAL